MSVLDHLLLCKIRNADLHVPSPSVCQVYTGLHHHVCWCWSMNVRMRLPAASSPPHLRCWHPAFCFHVPRTHQRFSGCHRRNIFISILPSSASAASLHIWKHPFLPSSPAQLPSQNSPLQPPWIIWDSGSGVAFWVDPPSSSSSSASLGLLLQLSLSPIIFFTIALWSAPEKAGKLSLPPAKASVGWAAGLPLSLWRMILWMETEEMALGELLERLRTVIQTIGGCQGHTRSL